MALTNDSFSMTLSRGLQRGLDGLIKVQTFTPIFGVIPAALSLPVAVIVLVTAIALKTLSRSSERAFHNDTLLSASLVIPYSLLNLCTLGFFAPIFEYKTQTMSCENEVQFATAGFFDLIFPKRPERPLVFLGSPPHFTAENFAHDESSSESTDSEL